MQMQYIGIDNSDRLLSWDIYSSVGKALEKYSEAGHPYVRDFSIGPELAWVLTMNPTMCRVLNERDFVEVDVTYRIAVELEYLFNVVAFNYTTLRCKYVYNDCIVIVRLYIALPFMA